MEIVHSLHMPSFMEKKAQLAFHKQVIFIKRPAHSKGSTYYPFLFLFHIKDNVHFKFFFFFFFLGGGGGGKFKNSKFFQKSYFCTSVPVLDVRFFACAFLSFFCLFCVLYECV